MNKTILLASFIFPERLDWFLDYLDSKFGIKKDKVFAFKNLDDESKVIVTFKFVIRNGKRVNLKSLFPNAIPIHKKGTAIYTINALNKLIETNGSGDLGNIDYKSVKINWDDYQDKILLYNNDKLNISTIQRIF
jgi:hypothetical protein|tara:strand:- start:8429 stop:8830 length:402 start_codon:yes stop_codon:yes gene_type:complete